MVAMGIGLLSKLDVEHHMEEEFYERNSLWDYNNVCSL